MMKSGDMNAVCRIFPKDAVCINLGEACPCGEGHICCIDMVSKTMKCAAPVLGRPAKVHNLPAKWYHIEFGGKW